MSVPFHESIQSITQRFKGGNWLLPGEEVKERFPNVNGEYKFGLPIVNGTLYITNYQIIFTFIANNQELLLYQMPLGSLFRIKAERKKSRFFSLICKHHRDIEFGFETYKIAKKANLIISTYAFPPSSHQLFAFVYKLFSEYKIVSNFSLQKEYERIGLYDDETLKELDNSKFNFCDTYPEHIFVPAAMSLEQINAVCSFRSRGRIPAVVWKHPVNGGRIIRCAQPCVGLNRNRSQIDEKMLEYVNHNPNSPLYILDSRPKANAVANMLRGGGYEFNKVYKNMEIEFNDIENIHVMRGSVSGVYDFANYLQVNSNLVIQESDHLLELEETKWLEHLRLVLVSAVRVASLIHEKNASVLVHCSDGWDRTAQTSSLAQILLDPFYRTIEGLINLTEKEWLHFGHQFALRYGHNQGSMGNYQESQRAPIFPQWVDILYQLTVICPTAFEWNESFLLFLMHELYSCRFGTFLFNSHKQRKENNIFDCTVSCWSYVLSNKPEFTNPDFVYDPSYLSISLSTVSLRLWTGYFLQHRRKVNHFLSDFPDLFSETNIIRLKNVPLGHSITHSSSLDSIANSTPSGPSESINGYSHSAEDQSKPMKRTKSKLSLSGRIKSDSPSNDPSKQPRSRERSLQHTLLSLSPSAPKKSESADSAKSRERKKKKKRHDKTRDRSNSTEVLQISAPMPPTNLQ